MIQESTILQDLIKGYFASPEFRGYVENPTRPIEADSVFPSIVNLAPYDSRTQYVQSVIANNQNIAGEIARGSNSSTFILGFDTTTQVSYPIIKIAKSLSYTNEVLDKFTRQEAILQARPDVGNIGLFLDRINFSPKLLIDAINRGIEETTWFGSHVATALAEKGEVSADDYQVTGSTFGVFSNPDVTSIISANTGSGSGAEKTLWKNKTAEQIIADLIAISNSMEDKMYKKPNVLAISMHLYNYLNQTLINTSFAGDKTIMDAIKKALPSLNVVGCYRMNNLSEKLNDGFKERAVMLIKDPDYMSIVTSQRGVLDVARPYSDVCIYRMHAYTTGLYISQKNAINILTNI